MDLGCGIHHKRGPIKIYRFFANDDDYTNLKVSELHYHPKDKIEESDTISGKSYEFIEFINTGETALNLSGFKLESAVSCEFPDKTMLPPKGFYVVATKPKYFYEAYGRIMNANCDGFFSNSGEHVVLMDSAGNEILAFTYGDKEPWPESADGEDYSLSASEKYPTGNPDDPEYWGASSTRGGSPFALDSLFTLNIQDQAMLAEIIQAYPNPVKDILNIQSNSPGDEEISIRIGKISLCNSVRVALL